MKKFTHYLFYLFILVFSLVSCSIEKRVYMPGYHTQWGLNRPGKVNSIPLNQIEPTDKPDVIAFPQIPENTLKPKGQEGVPDDKMVASSEEIPVFINNKKVMEGLIEQQIHSKIKEISFEKTSRLEKKNIGKKLVLLKKNHVSDDPGNPALRIIGWIVLSVGLFLLLLVNILLGALLMLLGLIFVTAGAKKKDSPPSSSNRNRKNDSEYVEVVYLKNGSIIRGMIIEQIPNVSLKIQTRDGNVFVYKMEEVEKITKELSK